MRLLVGEGVVCTWRLCWCVMCRCHGSRRRLRHTPVRTRSPVTSRAAVVYPHKNETIDITSKGVYAESKQRHTEGASLSHTALDREGSRYLTIDSYSCSCRIVQGTDSFTKERCYSMSWQNSLHKLVRGSVEGLLEIQ